MKWLGFSVFSVDEEYTTLCDGSVVLDKEILAMYIYTSSRYHYIGVSLIVETPINSSDSVIKSACWTVDLPLYTRWKLRKYRKEVNSESSYDQER